jgi:hypothetical protein
MPTNRVVALAGAIVTLILALLPVIADFDWRSTAGIVAGIIAVLGIVQKFLEGWSRWETAETVAQTAVVTAAAAGAQVPGLSEGVKAEGFQPPVED